MYENIVIKGAFQHNLKNIDVTIPRNKLVVITGLSGSGKSSLAFDTLYAEGQRRYVESLSAYARQFLDRLQKPKVEHIEGLSPAIAIEQRTAGSSPRSTVATVTEIYDYLRLLYTHIGIPHCPDCGIELKAQSVQAICANIEKTPSGSRLMLLAPLIDGKKGELREVFQRLMNDGFLRVRVDGQFYRLDDEESIPKLEKNKRHNIDAVVDRLIAGEIDRTRLSDSVELALKLGEGMITILTENDREANPDAPEFTEEKQSEYLCCTKCGKSFGKMLPRNFSFNSPYGACPVCNGLGVKMVMDENMVIPDRTLSIKNGAIPAWRRGPRHLIIYYNLILRKLAEQYNYPEMLTLPFEKIRPEIQQILLYGSGDVPLEFDYTIRGKRFHWSKPFEGVLPNLDRRILETENEALRQRLQTCQRTAPCDGCHGARLNKLALAVTINDVALDKFNAMSVEHAIKFIDQIRLNREQQAIAGDILQEIRSRLKFLHDVGLGYLSLDRSSGTLSGGEAQRIRLATQLGCALVGVLYILDEPSIGLHQRDNARLLNTLTQLRDIGNTVIVVEHDSDTILAADYLLDIGPGAGEQGGYLVAAGTPQEVAKNPSSLTGQFISGKREIPIPTKRLPGNGEIISIIGAAQNNLKNINVDIPLGTLCCVTGVSGSGKSSLINEILVRALNAHCDISDLPRGKCKAIKGLEHIDKAIVIDQTPIGRTPRSNPATYTDAFNTIRNLFAELPESKARGYKPGRFSFNVKGGRCEECKGDGIKKIEMQFLSDVYVECSSCNGRRFNAETLEIKYKKHSIADVLELTVDEAVKFFDAIPQLKRKFSMLQMVGLGYIRLGQAATTLSGGEAQRVKLATELSRIPRGHTIYILDEPTTGLHMADIEQLLKVLYKLRDKGNTVLVIEHNLDVIKCADYIIDLGPEGGADGGQVIAVGTPEQVAAVQGSYTGEFLKKILKKSQ